MDWFFFLRQVKLSVLWAYAKSINVCLAFSILLFMVVAETASVGTGIWLARWSSANVTSDEQRDMYLGVYGGLGFCQALAVLTSSFCLALGSKIASRYLHQSLLVNIMHLPMAFFETTPLGRIVNRFSKDISTIDDQVPTTLMTSLRTFLAALGILVAISFATPIFLAVILPLGCVYVFVQVMSCKSHLFRKYSDFRAEITVNNNSCTIFFTREISSFALLIG